LVDRHVRRRYASAHLTPEQITAETDKSGGVLLASGYIAGGAIAGIVIAFMAGLADPSKAGFPAALAAFNDAVAKWSDHNPFFAGPQADLLALIPFLVLCVLLYLAGRDLLFGSRPKADRA
jgi:hypothetical protein